MASEIDINIPITVTSSKLSKDHLEVHMSLVDGTKLTIPMLALTAKGIGITLVTIADGLAARNGKSLQDFDIQDSNLN